MLSSLLSRRTLLLVLACPCVVSSVREQNTIFFSRRHVFSFGGATIGFVVQWRDDREIVEINYFSSILESIIDRVGHEPTRDRMREALLARIPRGDEIREIT